MLLVVTLSFPRGSQLMSKIIWHTLDRVKSIGVRGTYCPLIFVTQVKNCTCQNQELTTWSVASVIAELLFGKIFLRISALQNLYTTSREVLINGSLYRTLTQQICKPVNSKFYLRWISSLFYNVILIFLPCFIHSKGKLLI